MWVITMYHVLLARSRV